MPSGDAIPGTKRGPYYLSKWKQREIIDRSGDWISADELAAQTGFAPSTVRRHVLLLARAGKLKRRCRFGPGFTWEVKRA